MCSGVLYSLMRELRSKPRNEVEAHFDDPTQSPVFQRFPSVIKNDELPTFICDYCRLIIIGNARTHEIEALMDEEIQTVKHDKLKAYHSMVTMSEAFPALGIVAAVLGVIKAMGALDQAPEVLGHLIGAALVGTFAGIFFSYAVVSPIATKIKIVREKKMRLYVIVKQTLLAFMNGAMPQIALEHGRKTISAYERPTIDEVEQETLAPGGWRRRRGGTQGGGVAGDVGRQPRTETGTRQSGGLFDGRLQRRRASAYAARGIRAGCGRLRGGSALQQSSRRQVNCRVSKAGPLPTCWARTTAKAPSAVLQPPSWNARLLVSARPERRVRIVETMLGGDGSHRRQAPERPLSKIEMRVAGLSSTVSPKPRTRPSANGADTRSPWRRR